MANIKTISRSDYKKAEAYAAKYDISISQAVKRFEDIEELEAATGTQYDAVKAEMFARLGWASLAPATPILVELVEAPAPVSANKIATQYIQKTCIVMNEAELTALADSNQLDIETMREAFVACGGEMIVENDDAPQTEDTRRVIFDGATYDIDTDDYQAITDILFEPMRPNPYAIEVLPYEQAKERFEGTLADELPAYQKPAALNMTDLTDEQLQVLTEILQDEAIQIVAEGRIHGIRIFIKNAKRMLICAELRSLGLIDFEEHNNIFMSAKSTQFARDTYVLVPATDTTTRNPLTERPNPYAIEVLPLEESRARFAADTTFTGHECSVCGTRWASPDYSACPRCAQDERGQVKPGSGFVSGFRDSRTETVTRNPLTERDAEIAALKARITALEERETRNEAQAVKYREFVRDMCGYSFSDKGDSRFVSDCIDELEGK